MVFPIFLKSIPAFFHTFPYDWQILKLWECFRILPEKFFQLCFACINLIANNEWNRNLPYLWVFLGWGIRNVTQVHCAATFLLFSTQEIPIINQFLTNQPEIRSPCRYTWPMQLNLSPKVKNPSDTTNKVSQIKTDFKAFCRKYKHFCSATIGRAITIFIISKERHL